MLQAYFRSGWAFLIPYLAAYLLYAWLDLPVNPAGAGSMENEAGPGISDSASRPELLPSPFFYLPSPPPLLHVYWFLHAAHVLLAGFALWSWWGGRKDEGGRMKDEAGDRTGLPATRYSLLATFQKSIPWVLLALLFFIPGVYLEFPSDPWHHYGRTNDWLWVETVTGHGHWKKSSYFIAYSLIGHFQPPALQLRAFDLYYTGCCLLLAWQYYRLARVVGLGERGAFVFVLLNFLTFGNNTFGFYRYYGMGSTLFAQLGAVALTRIALEVAARGTSLDLCFGHKKAQKDAKVSGDVGVVPVAGLGEAGDRTGVSAPGYNSLPATRYSLLRLGAAGLCLLPLIALNHVQGLGIAALGVGAVITWRLVAWRRSLFVWLALAAAVSSWAVIRWYPRHELLDSVYRPHGWLSSWYGFNLLATGGPAVAGLWTILGAAGFLNLGAGLWLLRRNHPAAWLTVFPPLALCLPVFAVPFASSLAAAWNIPGGYIMVFVRMFFAVPAGLALVVLGAEWWQRAAAVGSPSRSGFGRFSLSHLLLPLALLALILVPGDRAGGFNRFYQILMRPPDDLAMRHVVTAPLTAELRRQVAPGTGMLTDAARLAPHADLLSSPGMAEVLNTTGATRLAYAQRVLSVPVLLTFPDFLEKVNPAAPPFGFQPHAVLTSPRSTVGLLSGHWLPAEVALEHAAQPELFNPAVADRPVPGVHVWLRWQSPADDAGRLWGQRTGEALTGAETADRGRLNFAADEPPIRAGDVLRLRPALRSSEGRGLLLTTRITGPGLTAEFREPGLPWHPARQQWFLGTHPVRIHAPGRHEVELTAALLRPRGTVTVRYHFDALPAAGPAPGPAP